MVKVFKNIIPIILILFISFQSVNLIVYYSLFKLNQKAIAEELCEKIVNDCNACCYLDKKMSENTTGNSEAENLPVNNVKIVSLNFIDLIFYQPTLTVNYHSGLFLNLSSGFLENTSPVPIV